MASSENLLEMKKSHKNEEKSTGAQNSLPPANVVCEGYDFTPVCQSFCSWGACVAGGHAWQGGHTWQGACVAHRGECVAGWGACVVGGVWQGGHVWRGGGDVRARYYKIRSMSGGTHPTRMHSCFKNLYRTLIVTSLVASDLLFLEASTWVWFVA